MNKLLCPSMMCCDIGQLKTELSNLEDANIDIFHIDVMDGHYVPNLGIGMQTIEYIVDHSAKQTDAHLMVTNPEEYIDQLCAIGVDIIYIHSEVVNHPIRLLQRIKKLGAKPGIAISPNLSISQVEELLPYVEYILVMTVSPGFAGQQYLSSIDHKIEKLVSLKSEYEYKIILDGAIGMNIIEKYRHTAVDGYVLGTSVLFGKDQSYSQIIENLRS